jgi:protein TonB
MARRMRHEGVVVLTLQVDTHGKLVRPPIIQRSSGFDILDREAIRMVQAASPLPPLPKEFTKASISFNVPIRFSLR